jgi:hypothetical protein
VERFDEALLDGGREHGDVPGDVERDDGAGVRLVHTLPQVIRARHGRLIHVELCRRWRGRAPGTGLQWIRLEGKKIKTNDDWNQIREGAT